MKSMFYLLVFAGLILSCSKQDKSSSLPPDLMKDLSPKGCSIQKLNDCSQFELERCKIDKGACDSKKVPSVLDGKK